jgi:hypothetical protein
VTDVCEAIYKEIQDNKLLQLYITLVKAFSNKKGEKRFGDPSRQRIY